LEFLESLESFCQKQIFNNKERWFEPGLTMLDIENSFVSPTKTYKSGKLHSVRCQVPIRMGKCNLKIFNEQEQDVLMEEVKENTSVMTILEIQGIRCSARSFQLDLEIKQMMILKPTEDLFEKCVFGKGNTLAKKSTIAIPFAEKEVVVETVEESNSDTELEPEPEPEPKSETKDPSIHNIIPVEDNPSPAEPVQESDSVFESNTDVDVDMDTNMDTNMDTHPNASPPDPMDLETPKEESLEENENGLCPVNLTVPLEDTEEIKLKNPNEVYYEMYKEAKRKAQIARDLAISSYLSAKQIKHNYLPNETFSDDETMAQEEKELKSMNMESDEELDEASDEDPDHED
jgi:hypothetical protein